MRLRRLTPPADTADRLVVRLLPSGLADRQAAAVCMGIDLSAKSAVVAHANGTVRIWDLATETVLAEVSQPTTGAVFIDSRSVLIADDYRLYQWTLPARPTLVDDCSTAPLTYSRRVCTPPAPHVSFVSCRSCSWLHGPTTYAYPGDMLSAAAVTRDGHLLFRPSHSSVEVLALPTLDPHAIVAAHDYVRHVATSDIGDVVWALCADDRVCLLDVAAGTRTHLWALPYSVHMIATTANGRYGVAVGSYCFSILDGQGDDRRVATFKVGTQQTSCALSADGASLFVGDKRGDVRVYGLHPDRQLAQRGFSDELSSRRGSKGTSVMSSGRGNVRGALRPEATRHVTTIALRLTRLDACAPRPLDMNDVAKQVVDELRYLMRGEALAYRKTTGIQDWRIKLCGSNPHEYVPGHDVEVSAPVTAASVSASGSVLAVSCHRSIALLDLRHDLWMGSFQDVGAPKSLAVTGCGTRVVVGRPVDEPFVINDVFVNLGPEPLVLALDDAGRRVVAKTPAIETAQEARIEVIYLSAESEASRVVVCTGPIALAATCAAYSGDGVRLAIGSADGTVEIRDEKGARGLRLPRAYTPPVRCVALSPDGDLALVGYGDGVVRVWDVESATCRDAQVLGADTPVAVALCEKIDVPGRLVAKTIDCWCRIQVFEICPDPFRGRA